LLHKWNHIVPEDYSQTERVRIYLGQILKDTHTNSAIKKLIKKGKVLINKEIADSESFISSKCKITILGEESQTKQGDFPHSILFMDEHLIVAIKPAGLVSSGNQRKSFQEDLKYIPPCLLPDALPFPLLIHRLDKATSGIMIAARTREARIKLGEFVASDRMKKTYVALVEGNDVIKQTISFPIDNKLATTIINATEPTSTKDPTSFLIIELKTGRTHQIRKHLQQIGHPIVGDPLYNQGGLHFHHGLFLAAIKIEMQHPIHNTDLKLEMPIPDKFLKYLEIESK